MNRYETLAEEIAQSIRTGVIKLGDRLPSVRQTSTTRGVSPSTVFEAYYLLEARGLIRARERSGYYVIAGARVLPPEPEQSAETLGDSKPVDVSQLVFDVLESVKTRDVVPLGSAFCESDAVPPATAGQIAVDQRAEHGPVEHGR